MPRRKRWYSPILAIVKSDGPNSIKGAKPASAAMSRGVFAFTLGLVAASGALLGFGLSQGAGWAWKTGAFGVLVGIVLLFVLTRSLERRLWAAFFTFMTGAAGSLAAPVYEFAVAGRVGDTSNGLSGSGVISSGGSPIDTILWFVGALIFGLFALKVRRG